MHANWSEAPAGSPPPTTGNCANRRTVMKPLFRRTRRCGRRAIAICGVFFAAAGSPAFAAGCGFKSQGEGRVAAVLDARSFRLQDGREVHLAGIKSVASEKSTVNRQQPLATILGDGEVRLRGEDDTPDRYGRQPAFVFPGSVRAPGAVGGTFGARRGAGVRHRDRKGMC